MAAQATEYSLAELKDVYKTLLKDKAERVVEGERTDSSPTYKAVLAARQSAGSTVTFDSSGQVVVDKKAAERIIRLRLACATLHTRVPVKLPSRAHSLHCTAWLSRRW